MKYCTKCRHQLADDMLYCPKCGTKSEPISAEPAASPLHSEVNAAAPQQTYPASAPTKRKPRRVLKGISIFCLFAAALMLFVSVVSDSAMLVGALMYGILGVLFLMLSKRQKAVFICWAKKKASRNPRLS